MSTAVATVLASAVLAAIVTVPTQGRQHRHEREESLRVRMIAGADELAVSAVTASGERFMALPYGSGTLRGGDPNTDTLTTVKRALRVSRTHCEKARAQRQRVALLYGQRQTRHAERKRWSTSC